jgi:hypothetical protein
LNECMGSQAKPRDDAAPHSPTVWGFAMVHSRLMGMMNTVRVMTFIHSPRQHCYSAPAWIVAHSIEVSICVYLHVCKAHFGPSLPPA